MCWATETKYKVSFRKRKDFLKTIINGYVTGTKAAAEKEQEPEKAAEAEEAAEPENATTVEEVC